jgi:type II secretory pathway component PulJ
MDRSQLERTILGDWMGSRYSAGGSRSELILSLRPDGSYQLTERSEPEQDRTEAGRFTYRDADDVLEFAPGDLAKEPRRYWVLDVKNMEKANTFLVLRWVALASRNLPILLYRVHHEPHGRSHELSAPP